MAQFVMIPDDRDPHLGKEKSLGNLICSCQRLHPDEKFVPKSSPSQKLEKRGSGIKRPKLSPKEAIIIFACIALIILPFLALKLSPILRHPFLNSLQPGYPINKVDTLELVEYEAEKKALQLVLQKAAMPDGTVIITTLNEAWAAENAMIDLLLESFYHGEGTRKYLEHLVVVALDQKAYDRCLSISTQIYCYMLKTEGVDFSGEKFFMSGDYLKLMWRRIDFLRIVLEEGYNFLFTDADIMWLRDPFLHLSPVADFQIACDHFTGYPSSLHNQANGGFAFARANKRTIEFYKYWYKSRELYPDKHDQDVLNAIKYDEALANIGLRMKFLDTTYYAGFCEGGKDMEKVCTMHANCCLGLDTKLHDLRLVLSEWKMFKYMSPQERKAHNISWSTPKECTFNWPY